MFTAAIHEPYKINISPTNRGKESDTCIEIENKGVENLVHFDVGHVNTSK